MTLGLSTPLNGMTWREQQLRDTLQSGEPLYSGSRETMCDVIVELDRCRATLQQIQKVAQSHVDQKETGYGFWESIVLLTKKGLGLP